MASVSRDERLLAPIGITYGRPSRRDTDKRDCGRGIRQTDSKVKLPRSTGNKKGQRVKVERSRPIKNLNKKGHLLCRKVKTGMGSLL